MSLLKEYYDSLAQQGAAKTALDYAQTQLTQQQADQVGPNAQSQRALQDAQRQGQQQQAQHTAADTQQIAPNAASARSLDSARATQVDVTSQYAGQQAQADIARTRAQTTGLQTDNLLNRAKVDPTLSLPGYSSSPSLASDGGSVQGGNTQPVGVPLAKTGTDVQGDETGGRILTKGEAVQGKAKKPGPTDTVPAMLTPGESVLNKGATEHYGTDVIDAMNKMGLLRMGAQSELAKHLGLPDPHAAPAKGKDGKSDAKAAPAKGKGKGDPVATAQGFMHGASNIQPLGMPAPVGGLAR